MARAHYLLDNQQSEAGQRFDALGTLFNPSTFRHMGSMGLSPGWRVWEVGAGAASVPAWIAEQTKGHVLATDIDTTWLEAEDDGFVVKRHDIGTEPAPDDSFDLVHARLVLVHVPQRSKALATMIDALKPGGWLLVEEADPGLQPLACPDDHGAAEKLVPLWPNEVWICHSVASFQDCSELRALWTCSRMPTFRSAALR